MKLIRPVALITLIAGIVCCVHAQPPGPGGPGPFGPRPGPGPFGPPVVVEPVPVAPGPVVVATPGAPPGYVAGLRSYAHEAAKQVGYFLDNAKRVPIRSKEQGDALAAIRALHNSTKQYANATVSARWPRPDWLRYCSENLLDTWIRVDQSFPMLQAPPPVMDWWSRAQGALVALYNAATPYMGKPSGGPLPLALGGSGARGTSSETVPVVRGEPVVR